jgi:SAM-dependent methyltransferase
MACLPESRAWMTDHEERRFSIMSSDIRSQPIGVAANVDRWSAADEGWRGYRTVNGRRQLTERITNALALITPTPGGAMLDIGCANGVLTGYFARRAQVGSVLGADIVDLNPPFPLRQVNLDSQEPLPFTYQSFDVVICLETIEHVHDTDHLASEIRRILRPRGYAIISVPRLDSWLNIGLLALGYLPPAVECSIRRRYGAPDSSTRTSGHVSYFTRRSLIEWVRANGFSLERWTQTGIYTMWRYSLVASPALWQALPLWLMSKVPFKQDVLIARIRREEGSISLSPEAARYDSG